MLVAHTFHARGACPADGSPDYYRVRVYADRFVRCEELVAAAEELLAAPVYQEEFTQRLADKVGFRVLTRCLHLRGAVKVRCECEPAKKRR